MILVELVERITLNCEKKKRPPGAGGRYLFVGFQ